MLAWKQAMTWRFDIIGVEVNVWGCRFMLDGEAGMADGEHDISSVVDANAGKATRARILP